MTNLKDFFYFLFRPSFWIMLNPYDQAWDQKLNELLDKYPFSLLSPHTAQLGDVVVWISNYPYSTFRPYGDLSLMVRPKRRTILKARKQLMRDIFK